MGHVRKCSVCQAFLAKRLFSDAQMARHWARRVCRGCEIEEIDSVSDGDEKKPVKRIKVWERISVNADGCIDSTVLIKAVRKHKRSRMILMPAILWGEKTHRKVLDTPLGYIDVVTGTVFDVKTGKGSSKLFYLCV